MADRLDDLWAMLAGPQGRLAVRYPSGVVFIPVGQRQRFGRILAGLSYDGDVEVCPQPVLEDRYGHHLGSSVLWVRVETPDAEARLSRFGADPTLVVREGRGARLTALWALSGVLSRDLTRRLNRRLAYHLGCKLADAGPNFHFAPPGSVLRKGRKRPVVAAVECWTGELHSPRRLAGGLRDPVERVWTPDGMQVVG